MMSFRSLLIVVVVVALISTSSAFLTTGRPRDGAPTAVAQATIDENMISHSSDDAAVKLAFEAAGGFKEQFEAHALVDVASKQPLEETDLEQQSHSAITDEKVNEDEDQEVEEEKDEWTVSSSDDSSEAMQVLETKLHHWEAKLKLAQDAHHDYLQQQTVDHKTKPIYKREGKVDIYTLRPVYDKETERIQTQIWKIKEQILLLHAKMTQERRVDQVRQETAERIANFDAEIQRVKNQYEAQLDEKDHEMEQMREESANLLAAKEEEIDSLREEIQTLIAQLQDKRKTLREKKTTIATLETQLQEKESLLETLQQERGSLRKLARQSGRVLKTRFQRRVMRRGDAGEEDDDVDDEIDDNVIEDVCDNINDNDEDILNTANDEGESEKVLFPARRSKDWWM